MIKRDDRTPEQQRTHTLAVVARDKFLSGWGDAANGASRCAWALEPGGNIRKLERWVKGRSEMRYVTVISLRTYRPPRGTAHFHIYVADKAWIETL